MNVLLWWIWHVSVILNWRRLKLDHWTSFHLSPGAKSFNGHFTRNYFWRNVRGICIAHWITLVRILSIMMVQPLAIPHMLLLWRSQPFFPATIFLTQTCFTFSECFSGLPSIFSPPLVELLFSVTKLEYHLRGGLRLFRRVATHQGNSNGTIQAAHGCILLPCRQINEWDKRVVS